MKRIVLAFATMAMLSAGAFAIPGVGPIRAAKAAAVSPQAAHRGPYASAHRGGYAAPERGPYASARGGHSASETRPDQRDPPPSIPYDADGPAYLPGQTRSTDFQLQH